MKRLLLGVLTVLSVIAAADFVLRPTVVNATWPELRLVRDPARDQGLNLGFAEVSGAFLSDVKVIIENPSGTALINTIVDGPWFFAPLPAGTYTVKAIFEDQVKQIKDIRLSENEVTIMVMYWDLKLPATQMMASLAKNNVTSTDG